jgi:hypothetical protein
MTDSYLQCTVCGRRSTTNFASSLRTGWEKCCGYTMRLIRTNADIEAIYNTPALRCINGNHRTRNR